MAHSDPRYDSYRPDCSSRLGINLRKDDCWTPTSKPATHLPSSLTARHHIPDILQSIEDHEEGSFKLPRVYDREVDRLIGRTVRAYRLVVNYQRACPTGRRWTPEHIQMIKEAGKTLESDMISLESLRGILAYGEDAVVIAKLCSEAYALRDRCWLIQDLIKIHEQVPRFYGGVVEVHEHDSSVILQFRNPFVETVGLEGVEQAAMCVRRDTPVELRDQYPLTQLERHNGNGRRRDRRGYFASDSWRPRLGPG
jgi:hypothetical protein